MISYSAAMASWAQIKEGLGQVSSQLTAGKAVTAEIMMNVIGYLAAIADMGNRMEGDHSKLNMRVMTEFGEVKQKISTEFGEVKQKILVHQGAIEVLAFPCWAPTRIRSATGTIAW